MLVNIRGFFDPCLQLLERCISENFMDRRVTPGSNVLAYWGVSDADLSYKRLLELGATRHRDVQKVGGGIRLGTVLDPFGNILGVIENPHFKIEDSP